MQSLTLNIAQLALEIKFSSQKWLEYCRQKFQNFIYTSSGKPDLIVTVKFVSGTSLKDVRWVYKSPQSTRLTFPDSLRYFQWLNYDIKNIFAGTLLIKNGCFIHASSVVLEDNALIFAGKSGQGKSTAAGVLKLPIVADDRSIIRFINRQPFVFGSPFYERRDFAKIPGRYQLKAVFLLKKDRLDEVKIEKISPEQAIFQFIPQIVVNDAVPSRVLKHQYLKAFDLAKLLSRSTAVYNLSFPFPSKSGILKKQIYDSIN